MQGHTKNRGGCVSEESHQLKDTPSTVPKSDSTKDHPPGYDDHARAAMVFRSTQPTANTLSKPKGNPTNYLSVSKMHGPIIGTYIINPSMHVPPTYLPPLGGGETERDRKNLHLHTHNGSVDVDIWLVGDQRHPEARKDRTTLHVSSGSGSITVKVHAIDAIEPFFLDVFTSTGQITVFLPRSFHGPVALESRYGSHTLSEELLQNSTLLGVVGYTTRFFVGDFLAACDSVSQWEDYELKVETRDGWVSVKYVDEVGPGSKPGLFSRIFSK
ncbi:hypothetical protein EDD16DRAFT_575942 [Pisolithus croceorrhizus]|nr:hypothetical protein EDD16DRAFT_575942 [Pisolithus croceorrhizus]